MGKSNIKIGKHTLETLTTGMYKDPKIIFREYIQNAVDSIDKAVEEGYLPDTNSGRINITVDLAQKTIALRDNGTGISVQNIFSTLKDVGNSSKRYDGNRGFRGIGRLAGLSYAKKLQFITSHHGEDCICILTWDCDKLRELLQPGKYSDYDLQQVIENVTSLEEIKGDKDDHFFEVKLININDEQTELLDEKIVREYVSQVAPIGFDSHRFPFYNDTKEGIRNFVNSINKPLEEYNIYVNNDVNPLYKPYLSRVISGRGDNQTKDDVTKVEFFFHKDKNEKLCFWGWYGITSFLGGIKDSSVSGIRIRKGNILIGNGKTIDSFFSQSRFNAYFIGEVYVYDNELIPNGQRDDFERNKAYAYFKFSLSEIIKLKLSKIPSIYSEYNTAKKKIESGEKAAAEIEKRVKAGVSSETERSKLHKERDQLQKNIQASRKKLEKAAKKITHLPSKEIDNVLQKAEKLNERSVKLENKIIDSSYLLDKEKTLSGYSRNEKRIVKMIFSVIDENLESHDAKELQKKIIEQLKSNKNEHGK